MPNTEPFFAKEPILPASIIKLEGFQSLPAGWHFGDGGPIASETIDRAKKIVYQLMLLGLTRTDVFAGAGGEVLVSAYQGEAAQLHYVGVIVEPSGELVVRYELGGEEKSAVDVENVNKAKEAIRKVAEAIWSTSGFSIRKISTIPWDDSMNFLSRLREMGSPLSTDSVWMQKVA